MRDNTAAQENENTKWVVYSHCAKIKHGRRKVDLSAFEWGSFCSRGTQSTYLKMQHNCFVWVISTLWHNEFKNGFNLNKENFINENFGLFISIRRSHLIIPHKNWNHRLRASVRSFLFLKNSKNFNLKNSINSKIIFWIKYFQINWAIKLIPNYQIWSIALNYHAHNPTNLKLSVDDTLSRSRHVACLTVVYSSHGARLFTLNRCVEIGIFTRLPVAIMREQTSRSLPRWVFTISPVAVIHCMSGHERH